MPLILAFILGPLLILLPDKIWDTVWIRLNTLTTRLFYKKGAGEELISFVCELKKHSSLRTSQDLPQYKFYTTLVVQVLDYSRRFGAPIQSFIREIRHFLIDDQKFEKSLKGEIIGAVSQFLMVSAITWGFILSTHLLVQITPSTTIILLILSLQGGGILLFYRFFKKWKRMSFYPYECYYKSILTFKALNQVGLPVQQAMKISNIGEALEGVFSQINERLREAIKRWKGEGLSITEEIDEAIDELTFLMKESYGRFVSQMGLLKFGVLAIFFLPSYLLYIFYLFNRFFS